MLSPAGGSALVVARGVLGVAGPLLSWPGALPDLPAPSDIPDEEPPVPMDEEFVPLPAEEPPVPTRRPPADELVPSVEDEPVPEPDEEPPVPTVEELVPPPAEEPPVPTVEEDCASAMAAPPMTKVVARAATRTCFSMYRLRFPDRTAQKRAH